MRFLAVWLVGLAMVAAATRADAAWYEAKSNHFVIYGDGSEDELREFATKLERFDQAVRTARAMPDPPLSEANRLTVYLLHNEYELVKLEGGSGILGRYIPRAMGSVAYVTRNKARFKGDIDSDIIFFHEYAHHLMLQNSTAALPTWLVEGFAEFLSTAQVNPDGTVTFGAAANHRASGVLGLHHDLPLTMMLRETFDGLTPWQRELLYGRGWLLTHYLTFEPTRRGQLDRYVASMQQGISSIDSAKAAFGDLGTLDRELDGYAHRKQLTGIVVQTDAAKLGTVTVRAMIPAESAMMPVRVRSDHGVNERIAQSIVGQARKAAAPYPNDAFAQRALAEAEYDADNYEAADAAASRALAVDPKNLKALIYKGRAQMKLAKAKGAGADWNTVRTWFLAANKVDTEFAEPLYLFYRTFLESGETPTKNAVSALLYAVNLTPQDDYVRMLAVRELLVEKRLAEAKTMFAPVAYQPHGGWASRDVISRIMSAVTTGDATTALRLIDHERGVDSPAAPSS